MSNAKSRKKLTGRVISDKMNKTIVVQVQTMRQHYKYPKLVKKTTKFKVHDEKNEAKTGDTVRIIEARPMSKEKRWKLLEKIGSTQK